ncbi:hypothetical protein B0O80DRAFT_211621, partial [Mortierella sp. GBAus27b]
SFQPFHPHSFIHSLIRSFVHSPLPTLILHCLLLTNAILMTSRISKTDQNMDSIPAELESTLIPLVLQLQLQEEQEQEQEVAEQHKGVLQDSGSTSRSNAPINPTFLPEIAALIVKHLTRRELAKCALVCRAWSTTYTPFLWTRISTYIPTLEQAAVLPPILHKYGGLIRDLSITAIPQNLSLMTLAASSCESPSSSSSFSSIITSSSTTTSSSSSESSSPLLSSTLGIFDCEALQNVMHLVICTFRENKHWFRNIVHRNQDALRELSLRCTTLENWKKTSHFRWRGDVLFDFPKRLPYLHTLVLDQWALTRNEWILILKACPALKALEFSNIRIMPDTTKQDNNNSNNNNNNNNNNGSSSHLKEDPGEEEETFQHVGLEYFKMCSRLFLILDLIPNIKILEFYRFDRKMADQDLDEFCDSIRTHCHQLKEIWAYGFECSMLPRVIDSVPSGLVRFRGSSDIPTTLSVLSHSATVEEVNMADYNERTYLPLQFLEMCPSLRELRTGHTTTTMKEVQASIRRGWVCGDLTVLRLSIEKLSPVLIEAILQSLDAQRNLDSEPARALTYKPSSQPSSSSVSPYLPIAPTTRAVRNTAPQSAWMISQTQFRQAIMAAMDDLNPEQKAFREEVSNYLKGFEKLTRINLATGWYTIPR